MLRMDKHASEICQKTSKQLAVLKRLGRFLTKQGKMTIYNSFIVSNFNYYAPNFEEVEEAYWFGPVRPSVCYTCTRPRSVRDRILKFGRYDEYEN